MLIGIEAIQQYLQLISAKHFRIYDARNKRIPLFVYEQAGGTEGAKNAFAQWANLNNQYGQPVEYYMTAFPKGKPSQRASEVADGQEAGTVKDTMVTSFYLVSPAGANYLPTQQHSGIGGVYQPQDFESMRQKIREEFERDQEMEDLYEEMDELKAQYMGWQQKIDKVLGYVLPFIEGKLLPGNGTAPALAGPPDPGAPVQEQRMDPERVMINNALRRLHKLDPELGTHLEKLAGIAENSPATYKQLITMLNGL